MKRKLLIILAIMLALVAAGLFAAAEVVSLSVGDRMEDVEMETLDGEIIRLSELLERSEAVIFHQCYEYEGDFALWQEAAQRLGDKISVVMLVRKEDEGKTRILMRENDLSRLYFTSDGRRKIRWNGALPSSMLVDRFGVACWEYDGSLPCDADYLVNFLSRFLGEDYPCSQPRYGQDRWLPSVCTVDEALLSAAANAEGGTMAFVCANDPFVWPFVPIEGGISPSCVGVGGTMAVTWTAVQARAGEVFSFRLSMNTRPGEGVLSVYVNNEEVGARSGRIEKGVFAYEFPEDGLYEILVEYIAYEKTDADAVVLSDFALLSGAQARAALAAVPEQVKSLENWNICLDVLNEKAKKAVITGTEPPWYCDFFMENYYVVFDEEAVLRVRLGDKYDAYKMRIMGPDGVPQNCTSADAVDDEGYIFRIPLDGSEYGRSDVCADADPHDWASSDRIVLFASEEALNDYCQRYLPCYWGVDDAEWRYEDGSLPSTSARIEREELRLSESMEDFAAELCDGSSVSLQELLQTRRAVIVYFWGKGELDYFQFFQRACAPFGDSAVTLVLVDRDWAEESCDIDGRLRLCQEENGFMDVLMGHDSEWKLNTRDAGCCWVLLDCDGVIRDIGGAIVDPDELEARIAAILAEEAF